MAVAVLVAALAAVSLLGWWYKEAHPWSMELRIRDIEAATDCGWLREKIDINERAEALLRRTGDSDSEVEAIFKVENDAARDRMLELRCLPP